MARRRLTRGSLSESQLRLLSDLRGRGGRCDTAGLYGPDVVALIAEGLAVAIDGHIVLLDGGAAKQTAQEQEGSRERVLTSDHPA